MTGTLLENFRVHHQNKLSVLAVRRRHEIILTRLSQVGLREGDMLLIQGKKKDVEYLEAEKFFITLSEYEKKKTVYRKAIPAILIGIGVVLAAALNIVNILISAMIGALLMILTGVLKPEEAYKSRSEERRVGKGCRDGWDR